MEYGICLMGTVPLRANPLDKSEMVSQILFGEFVEIAEQKKDWIFVRQIYDSYTGWISTKQITRLDTDTYIKLDKGTSMIATSFPALIEEKGTGNKFLLPPGSRIFDKPGIEFSIAGFKFNYEGDINKSGLKISNEKRRKSIVDFSSLYAGAPYLWGGRTPAGIDCSGFTQVVYKMAGIRIPRDSGQQALEGSIVSFLSESKPGDLAFFENDAGEIIHTGILLNNQSIIHASGMVRTDTIDHHGIYDVKTKSYTHKLRLIKTFL